MQIPRLDTRGNIAILTALALPAILGVAGLAVDFGNAVRTRSHLQKSLDAAVLAAANPALSQSQRQTTFEASFRANYGTRFAYPTDLSFTYTTSDGATGSAAMPMATTVMSALGFDQVEVTATSTAKVSPIDLEVVLALDISGSMRGPMGGGTRLQALKNAATKLIDIIDQNKSPGQTIKFGVVPFNMAVNIGTDNAALVANTGHPLFSGTTWGGCVLERPGAAASTDDYSPGSLSAGRWPAYIWPPAPNSSSLCLNRSNGTNTGYGSVEAAPLGPDPWKDGPNFNCPRFPITRLTGSSSDVVRTINGLEAYPNMGTTIAPAVGWGFRMLSPTGPFADSAPFDGKTRKLLIVVTDGELVTDGWADCNGASNSGDSYRFDPADLGLAGRVLTSGPKNDSFTPYGYLLDSDPYNSGLTTALDADKELDRLAISACATVKARSSTAPIEIFTIAASSGAGPGTRAETVLSACASSPDNFIYAEDSDALMSAFERIGAKAMKLRLTN